MLYSRLNGSKKFWHAKSFGSEILGARIKFLKFNLRTAKQNIVVSGNPSGVPKEMMNRRITAVVAEPS